MRQPGTAFSEELLALFYRAETARRQAERLLEENDRWRRCVIAQLDYMFELGPNSERPVVLSLRNDRRNRNSGQGLQPLYDKLAMALPLGQGLRHQFSQALCLLDLVATFGEFGNQILLVQQPDPTLFDEAIGLAQMRTFHTDQFLAIVHRRSHTG